MRTDTNRSRTMPRTLARSSARRRLVRNRLAVAVSMGLMMTSGPSAAAVFNVTSAADSGPGTLRQAVLDANASPGADEITFSDGLGLIALTSGQIEYTETITLQGPPGGLIISGEDNSRILAKPRGGARADLTLRDLILTNGFNDQPFGLNCLATDGDGGAICTRDGAITLVNTVIANSATTEDTSRGGAIFSYGVVTLTDSIVVGNRTEGPRAHGGGIRASQLVLENSLVIDNLAQGFGVRGGGFDATSATLIDSTVSGNLLAGGQASGAGFEVQNLTMTQSTVSGNAASGADAVGGGFSLDYSGTVTLNNSTITANTSASGAGGFHARNGSSTVELISTILSGNAGPDGNVDTPGPLTATRSLFGDSAAEVGGASSQNVFAADPGLLPLADNGCAVEAGNSIIAQCGGTHDLVIASPAIDAGSNGLNLAADQRGAGFDRVIGAGIDIGAVETAAPAELRVTRADDSGTGSLREQVGIANGFAGVQTIVFDPGLPPIVLDSGSIEISDGLIIDGPVGGQLIDANGLSRIFTVPVPGASLDLARLTLINGATTADGPAGATSCAAPEGPGGAICTEGRLSLDQVTVAGSGTSGQHARGGGVVALGGLTLIDSVISGNTTQGVTAGGGGLFVEGDLQVTNSIIEGNSTIGSGASGGGARVLGAVTLHSSTISGNDALGEFARAGGLDVAIPAGSERTSTIDSSTISDNRSGRYGGGVYQIGGNLTLRNSTITGNSTLDGGAGVEFDDGSAGVYNAYTLRLDSVILSGNTGPDGNLRVQDDSGSTLNLAASFSLFGDAPSEFDVSSNMVFDDLPGVLALEDNGCFQPAGAPGFEVCVPTHRISDTSPALDAGDNPLSVAFDQRGSGFRRVAGPRADIGSIEIDPDLLFRNGFEP